MLYKDIKTDIPNHEIHKYKSTNIQIQLMTNCQKYPTYMLQSGRSSLAKHGGAVCGSTGTMVFFSCPQTAQ